MEIQLKKKKLISDHPEWNIDILSFSTGIVGLDIWIMIKTFYDGGFYRSISICSWI